MNSSRPYLVRALYEWIVDNDCTPHLLVNAESALPLMASRASERLALDPRLRRSSRA